MLTHLFRLQNLRKADNKIIDSIKLKLKERKEYDDSGFSSLR